MGGARPAGRQGADTGGDRPHDQRRRAPRAGRRADRAVGRHRRAASGWSPAPTAASPRALRSACPPHDHVGQARSACRRRPAGDGAAVVAERFDAAYYRRFYGRSPVHDRRTIGHLASGVMAFARWWRIPIRSVLDIGAGKAYWRDWLEETHPRVKYHGIDVSEHACRRYGHERADLATWSPSRSYDLVVCQSVLQYLDDASASMAIATLGDSCRGLLWLEVPTRADRTGRSIPMRPTSTCTGARRVVPDPAAPRVRRDRCRALGVAPVRRRVLRARARPLTTAGERQPAGGHRQHVNGGDHQQTGVGARVSRAAFQRRRRRSTPHRAWRWRRS